MGPEIRRWHCLRGLDPGDNETAPPTASPPLPSAGLALLPAALSLSSCAFCRHRGPQGLCLRSTLRGMPPTHVSRPLFSSADGLRTAIRHPQAGPVPLRCHTLSFRTGWWQIQSCVRPLRGYHLLSLHKPKGTGAGGMSPWAPWSPDAALSPAHWAHPKAREGKQGGQASPLTERPSLPSPGGKWRPTECGRLAQATGEEAGS